MLESRYSIGSGSGSGSVKGWHAAELAQFKAFHDREDNDHDIQNTKEKEEEDLQQGVGDSMTQLELHDEEEEEEEEEEGFDVDCEICCTEGNHCTGDCAYWKFVPAGVTVSSKYDIGCKFCGCLARYHGGEYGKDYKARVVIKECFRCWKEGHWDEECAGYVKSEEGDEFLKLLAKGSCIRLANI